MKLPKPPAPSLLATDLYQLTMAQAYLEHGLGEAEAVFEFFVRKLPSQRNFLLACGIEPLMDDLVRLRASEEELAFLDADGRFSKEFLDWLAEFRFTGDVDAVEEGEIVFANEPILRLRAPLPVAQIVETLIINRLQFSTMVASKAVRVRFAAGERLVVDFGMRRAHGIEAGLFAARAAYIAGLDGTSNVEAGMRFAIPIFGTMAHSFVQAHADEAAAFRDFAATWPENVVLLVDTYDTLAGVDAAIALAKEGVKLKGIRLDSGDLLTLAKEARRMLDAAGLQETMIFASGDLDEYRIAELVAAGAPIGGFGVGTKMVVSADAPYLNCAYKLMEVDGRPVRKKSAGKATLPGAKQLWRRWDDRGLMREDVIALADEEVSDATALLRPLIRGGAPARPVRPAPAVRDATQARLARLPETFKTLDAAPAFSVQLSARLAELAQRL